jgi:hypothetical protein
MINIQELIVRISQILLNLTYLSGKYYGLTPDRKRRAPPTGVLPAPFSELPIITLCLKYA